MGDNLPITMRNATMPNLNQHRGAIVLPQLAAGVHFELRLTLLQVLPEFRGSGREDPNIFLAESYSTYESTRPSNVPVDHVKLRCFPLTLKDRAKDWYYYLPVRSIHSWIDMEREFLDK